MKKFRIAPLVMALSIATIGFTVPVIASQAADGDLNIYTSDATDSNKSPTLLLMLEASTATNIADGYTPEKPWNLEILKLKPLDSTDVSVPEAERAPRPESLPNYSRYYYSMSQTGAKAFTRLTRMRDAIYYLMDTPGALPDTYRVGVGRYSSTTLAGGNIGDGLTGSVNVPALELGPVSKRDDPTSQRYKIKKFVAELCGSGSARYCTGESPMASAYAEAGAYMMGTKTSQLTYAPNETAPTGTDMTDAQYLEQPYTRALRYKYKPGKSTLPLLNYMWQYCPPEARQKFTYKENDTVRVRYECPPDKTDANGNIISAWINVTQDNIADESWANNGANDEADDTDLAGIANPQDSEGNPIKRKYDLLWDYLGGSNDRPHGTFSSAANNRVSPQTLATRDYKFDDDFFQNVNPTESNPAGSRDSWTYMTDNTLTPSKKLVPVLHYRKYRTKLYWSNGAFRRDWQYCPIGDAQLVNYIYSSYRLMCPEDKWITVTKDNYASYKPAVNWGNIRPAGIDGIDITADGIDENYWVDPILNPYNGWTYYYDGSFTSAKYPPLPPTLNNNYSTSGIRNTPPEVRNPQRYTYDDPVYSKCSGTIQYNSAGEPMSQGIDNAIFFFTTAETYTAGLRPLNEMNMSLTPAHLNTLQPAGGMMTTSTCDASGLDKGQGDFWNCIGEYSRRLNSSVHPINKDAAGNNLPVYPIKTGVFMFTGNDSIMTPIGTRNGLPIYNCLDPKNDGKQKSACLLGQYGAGYGEGGFFQSTGGNASDSYKTLAKAFAQMAQNLDTTVGTVPTSLPIAPLDPLESGNLLSSGYVPLIAPAAAGTSQWQGNLRKYKLNGSGNEYVDKNGNSPFNNKLLALLSPSTADLWHATDTAYPSAKQGGGVFENIPLPTTNNNARVVYLSPKAQDANGAGELSRVMLPTTNIKGYMDDIAKPTSDASVAEYGNLGNTIANTDEFRKLILNYMGFNITDYANATDDSIIKSKVATPNAFGGVNHSTPLALSTKATLTQVGDVKKYVPNNTYLLFGAMDNGLHIVDDSTGKEVLTYFPTEVLGEKDYYWTEKTTATKGIYTKLGVQYKGIMPFGGMTRDDYNLVTKPDPADKTKTIQVDEATQQTLTPAMGMDAPWSTLTKYVQGSDTTTLVAKELYAYGGARLGGKVYYGIDFTKFDENQAPKQLFAITPTTKDSTSNTPAFARLGYTWAKPVLTKIKWQGKPTSVVILSGGYDRAFDDANFNAKSATNTTLGNAIYIVDATTGKLLIRATNDDSQAQKTTPSPVTSASSSVGSEVSATGNNPVFATNAAMNHSIVASVKTLDRDADELTDAIYFADLAGQVFRMDINNKASTPTVNTKSRIIKLADLSSSSGNNFRFFESPAVTVHVSDAGNRFVAVSVASGDRSNPTAGSSTGGQATDTKDNNVNNTFVIFDKDIAKPSLYTLTTVATTDKPAEGLATAGLTRADLVYQPSKDNTVSESSKGWFVPLKYATKYTAQTDATTKQVTYTTTDITNSTAVKAFGPLVAIGDKNNSRLYVSAYNPDDGLTDSSGCTTQVQGTTEAYQYCLPYGVCDTTKDAIGQYQRIRVGKGITSLMVGGDSNKNRFLMRMPSPSDVTFATGTNADKLNKDGTAFKGLPDSSYGFKERLRPMGWFDFQLFKANQETQ